MCVEGYVKLTLDTFGNMLSKPALLPKSIRVGSRVIARGWMLVERDEDPKFNKYYNHEYGLWIAAGEREDGKLYCMGIWSPMTKLIYSNIYCCEWD